MSYFLTWRNSPTGIRRIAVPNVTGCTQRNASAVSSERTLDLGFYQEFTGVWPEFTLKGISGEQDDDAFTAEGEIARLSGADVFIELKRFIAEYEAEAAKTWSAFSRIRRPEMVFSAVPEDEAHLVKDFILDNQRDRESTGELFAWTLRITTRGKVSLSEAPASPLDATGEAPGEGSGSRPEPALTAFDNAELAVASSQTRAQRLLAAGSKFRTSFDRANRALSTFAQFRREMKAVASFPYTIASDVLRLARNVAREAFLSAEDLSTALPGAETLRTELTETANLYRQIARDVAVLLAVARVRPIAVGEDEEAVIGASTASSPGPTAIFRQGQRVAAVFIRDGETLPDIAERILGYREAWTEIASINGITDPWALGYGAPLPVGGSVILVPHPEGVAASSVDDVYGEDFAAERLPSGRYDLVCHPKGFVTSRGIKNYEQAILLRLLTRRKDLKLFPEYGILFEVGEYEDNIAERVADVRGQLLRDNRTRRVLTLRAEVEGDTIWLRPRVQPAGGDDVFLSVPLAVS